MARIVIGHLGGAPALQQAREVLGALAEEWPHLQLRTRTYPATEGGAPLLAALAAGEFELALLAAEHLPASLPEGVVLAAVPRRSDPRSALIASSVSELAEVPAGAHLGVLGERDRALLRVLRPDVSASVLGADLDTGLRQARAGEFDALIVPVSAVKGMGDREHVTPLETSAFTPAAGQGALALLAREDDDLGRELGYSLQHRPSYDRVRAERAASTALAGHTTGAVASVTADGELTLIACLVGEDGTLIQAIINGEANEAEELGRELARDMLEQLEQL